MGLDSLITPKSTNGRPPVMDAEWGYTTPYFVWYIIISY